MAAWPDRRGRPDRVTPDVAARGLIPIGYADPAVGWALAPQTMTASDRLLRALREMRAQAAEGGPLEARLLDVIRVATASATVTLHRPLAGDPGTRVGSSVDGEATRVERSFSTRAGAVVLTLESARGASFDADADAILEILGGECVLLVEEARAEREARRLRDQVELLRALARTGDSAPGAVRAVADRTAVELLRAFEGAHVLIHVVVDDHLELVARRTDVGTEMDDAPDWIRRVPLAGPTAMAVAAREARTVSRPIREVAEPRQTALVEMAIRHIVVVPLSLHDVVVGTLMVAHRKDEPWELESLRFLESVAVQVGVEIANARVLEAERRRADELGLVNELGRLVGEHLEPRAVLMTAATELARALQVARVHALLADDTRTRLLGVAWADDLVAEIELPLESSHAVAEAVRTRAPVIVHDAETDARTNKALVAEVGARALAVVPLVTRGAAIGVIVVVETRHRRRFSDAEVARIVAVANVVAPAVTNAKMFEDLRRSYEALARAQAELVTHERFAALGELSAVIAHEVRNPVAIIFNSLAELRRLALPAPEAQLLVSIIDEETARLNRLVGDLLDFVRPYHAHPREARLDAIVAGAVEAARRAARDHAIAVRTEVTCPDRALHVDATMLEHALINLIVNAIQATPAGKGVTVRATVLEGTGPPLLCCEVVDDGEGIDSEVSARMFEPFFTTKATGTGLGLALVRRLATALGGTIVARNAPTGGALFQLTIPVVGEPRDAMG